MPPLLPPVDNPGFLMRIVYRIAQHRYGKVLMPLRVIYARAPVLLATGLLIEWTRAHALAIEPELRALITVRVASRHGCEFCADLARALANQTRGNSSRVGMERFEEIDRWRESSLFSPRERTALAWVDDILEDGKIEETTLADAKKVFSERELIELTWLQASETYFNRQTRPLGIPSDRLT